MKISIFPRRQQDSRQLEEEILANIEEEQLDQLGIYTISTSYLHISTEYLHDIYSYLDQLDQLEQLPSILSTVTHGLATVHSRDKQNTRRQGTVFYN